MKITPEALETKIQESKQDVLIYLYNEQWRYRESGLLEDMSAVEELAYYELIDDGVIRLEENDWGNQNGWVYVPQDNKKLVMKGLIVAGKIE